VLQRTQVPKNYRLVTFSTAEPKIFLTQLCHIFCNAL
jgi:hypothetical protein